MAMNQARTELHADPALPTARPRPVVVQPPANATMTELTEPAVHVDTYLRELCQSLPAPGNLREAITYALLGPGKRLRPVLAWHCAAAVGADPRASLPAGAAVELVHAFSLVHDDLPAMDDDDLRRGRPTLHRHTNEAMAILAGDAMLTLAFEHLVANTRDPSIAAALVGELARGTNGMIAGQVYDTLGGFADGLPPIERLELIHHNKTGALLQAACRMGALAGLSSLGLAPASAAARDRLEAVTDYARAVGLMFQVVDDILDVTQPAEHVGKQTGKDAQAGKMTYPGVLGLDRSRAEVARLESASLAAADRLGPPGAPLAVLARFMAVRTK